MSTQHHSEPGHQSIAESAARHGLTPRQERIAQRIQREEVWPIETARQFVRQELEPAAFETGETHN